MSSFALKKNILVSSLLALIISISIAAIALQPQPSASRKTTSVDHFTEVYPYASSRFDRFIIESYDYYGSKDWKNFYNYMDRAYKKYRFIFRESRDADLKGMLDSYRSEINSINNDSQRTRAELALAANLHKFVKKAIPSFSLDRGYEFYYADKRGERQCFLQSVLIAGMLQRAGVNAGVVMVYKNVNGEQTNNGHAVDLVRLSNGRDIIVDASEQKPFAKQKGLFVKQSIYAFVDPVFASKSDEIIHYKAASPRKVINRVRVNALDYDFLRSQFWYYRGERATGGLLLLPKTANGLKKAERALGMSVRICPENPLAVFTLGRVYIAEGTMNQAKKSIASASNLYFIFGWMPDGVKEYTALLGLPKAGKKVS